jgi:hypothetical protein
MVLLAAMAGLIHAEVRDRRRAVHRGGPSPPHAHGQARTMAHINLLYADLLHRRA